MKRSIVILITIILVIGIAISLTFQKQRCKYKKIIAKSIIGKTGSSLGEFIHPCSLAIKGNYLFVADSGNSRIQVFTINQDGSIFPKLTYGNEGKGLGEFGDGLLSLAIKGNYLFVADSGNSRIQVFTINQDGSISSKSFYGKKGHELGEFGWHGLYLSVKKDSLFVADSGNSRIQIATINLDGGLDFNFVFGKEGQGLGEFGRYPEPLSFPGSIGLVSKDNYLYVTDSGNSRLQIMEIQPRGGILPKYNFGKKGIKLGEFMIPLGLAIEGDCLFVAEIESGRIQVLKTLPGGRLIPQFTFGKLGKNTGEFGLIYSLAVKRNFIYVADGENDCIHILELID